MEISQKCVNVSEMLLVKIDSRKVYENMEFDEAQASHRGIVQKRLKQYHDEIIATMRRTYEVFKSDGAEVWQFQTFHLKDFYVKTPFLLWKGGFYVFFFINQTYELSNHLNFSKQNRSFSHIITVLPVSDIWLHTSTLSDRDWI